MLNEASFIDSCLDGFAAQTWPTGLLDLIVVDGGSTDGSRQCVEARMASEPWLRLVDNPKQKAAAAFNGGLEQAKGDVVCLFSAHGVPDPTYVEASVRALDETGAAGVGGRYLHVGVDAASSAIGLAMVSPFGMASPHRFARSRQEVDTISHPAYRVEALRAVGGFDESLERNSDYEINYRLRANGQHLVFEPSISSIYRPRGSLRALARQFWWYGRWKVRVLQRHPGSLKGRHLVAPATVAGTALAPFLCLHRRGRRMVAIAGPAYAGLVMLAVVRAQPKQQGADWRILAASFPVMHASWGAGFLASLAEDWLRS
jgi:glycosyltransferase involved in cell wall biosynthesis